MSARPILFSGPMVRALLAGAKTQTRRVLKGAWQTALEGHDQVLTWFAPPHVPPLGIPNQWAESGVWARKHGPRGYNRHLGVLPHRPADLLWVRERGWMSPRKDAFVPLVDNEGRAPTSPQDGAPYKATPSIHMPRWASRLTLEVTEVRVQRLQEISEADAIAEGIIGRREGGPYNGIGFHWQEGADLHEKFSTGVSAYAALWVQINGPGSWDANPWVAAYTFNVHRLNVDDLLRERAA